MSEEEGRSARATRAWSWTGTSRRPRARCCGRSASRTRTSRARRSGSPRPGRNVTPCNMHIGELAREACAGVDAAGGKSVLFNTITVSDGISMGTPGMRYSLVSREIIADSIEAVAGAAGFDGFVAIGGCDKNMPGCAMAMARLNRPAVFVYGGTIRPGAQRRDIVSVFEAVGAHAAGTLSDARPARDRAHRDPGSRQLRRDVHGQHHGLGDRGLGLVLTRQLRAGGRRGGQALRLPPRRRGRGAPGARGLEAARHPHAPRVRECHHRGHRARRLHQRRAAPARDRARRAGEADAR